MKGISSTYSDFIVSTRFDDLRPEVIHQAKKLILDLIGVSLAGYSMMEFPRVVVDYMASLGGTPEATIFQTKKKFPAINAVFANAACAHALDMDDGHRFGALHPGTVIIPAALAATELSGASTKDLIAGVVVGYEVMIRIGMAIGLSSLSRGFHITGITGSFGATAAAGSIMGLSQEEIVGALGLAGLQSSGLIQVNHEIEGAKVKPINPARAASSGFLSCILSTKGARGPLNIFEGEDGYLKAVADEVKTDLLILDLGKKFEILNVYLKLYASCRHVHAPIEAALKAFNNTGIGTSGIRKIHVETYSAALKLAGIKYATTPSAARFSIPFSVALALVKKNAGADMYSEENVRDENIQNLARKVELSVGSKWEHYYPEKRGAKVNIVDNSNKTWSGEVDLSKGEPENPASLEEVLKKFYANARLLISEVQAQKIVNFFFKFEDISLNDFIKLI